MKIKTQSYNDDIAIVELQGEFTSDFAKSFEDTVTNLVKAHTTGLVLDMSKVNFIDSEALEQLLWLRDYCFDKSGQLKLAGLDENCVLILRVTRLDSEFDSYDELGEAIKSFA